MRLYKGNKQTDRPIAVDVVGHAGSITLRAVYEDTEQPVVNGYLLRLDKTGKLYRHIGISKEVAEGLGLQLDSSGRIKMVGED